MRDDSNYAAFAAAAWGNLVRAGIVLGCTPEEADDLAQTTLLKCYLRWRKVLAADNRDAYVYRVLLNAHRDSRRRRWWTEHPHAELPDEQASGPDLQAQVAVSDAVHQALGDLSLAHRQTVVLRYLAHLSEAETADVLGVAPGTVKSRLSRALKALASSEHLVDYTEGTRHGSL